jgi:prophage maintenance system killer protein
MLRSLGGDDNEERLGMSSKAGTPVDGSGAVDRLTSAGEVVLYVDADGTVNVDVRLERESIWLSLNQIATLFERDKSVISRHLRNVFASEELDRDATVAFFATVQDEGERTVERQVEYFNLDAIISVGYRVNSKRGTQFRVWATKVLREHLTKGYTANERRLTELNQTIRLISEVVDRKDLSGDEAKALLAIVGEYSFALDLLDDYDRHSVASAPAGEKVTRYLGHEEGLRIVDRLRERFGGGHLFGVVRDAGLESALGAVMQSVGGVDAYPTLEAKAAHLLYFVVKNHPFVDGNKRIGAALFLWFLEINGGLWARNGDRRLSEAALVATTLLIAESVPQEREVIIRVVTHLLSARPGD